MAKVWIEYYGDEVIIHKTEPQERGHEINDHPTLGEAITYARMRVAEQILSLEKESFKLQACKLKDLPLTVHVGY